MGSKAGPVCGFHIKKLMLSCLQELQFLTDSAYKLLIDLYGIPDISTHVKQCVC
jgi:hypothetical protein